MPWVYPQTSIGGTGGKGTLIEVPEIGARIVIEFLSRDINFPVYTGYWSDKSNFLGNPEINGFSDLFKNDYPNTYGFQDSVGNYELTNKKEGFTEYGYKSNVKYRIDKEGNESLKGTNKGTFEYLDDLEYTIQKDWEMAVTGHTHIKCNDVKIGNTDIAKEVVLKGHLDKYDNLVKLLNDIFMTRLVFLDALFGGAYAGTVITTWSAGIGSLPHTNPDMMEKPLGTVLPTTNQSKETKVS